MALRTFAPRTIWSTLGSILRTQTTWACSWPAWGCGPATPLWWSPPPRCSATPRWAQFAEHLGLTYQPTPGFTFDLVVVGTGPAGLASRRLRRLGGPLHRVPRRSGLGGQAGASSGSRTTSASPTASREAELTGGAAIQAQTARGVAHAPCEGRASEWRRVSMCCAGRRERDPVPSGHRGHRSALPTPGRATTSIASREPGSTTRPPTSRPGCAAVSTSSCSGAAIRLGRRPSTSPNRAAGGHRHPARRPVREHVPLPDRTDRRRSPHRGAHLYRGAGAGRRRPSGPGDPGEHDHGRAPDGPCSGLFCFIGAVPATDLARRRRGAGWQRVRPHRSLPLPTGGHDPSFAGRAPLPFETSVPGIFAVGDVRQGSLKRVASAVGEGSSAVRSVHDHLATSA